MCKTEATNRIMATLKNARKQHLKVNEQLEMPTTRKGVGAAIAEDFESKLVAAEHQLEQLQRQQELIEQEKLELEELTQRKEEFLEGQVSITERLTSTLTAIDRELYDMRKDMEDLEQTRKCFAEHLQTIDNINPDSWSREELKHELTRAISMLDHAEDEYDEALTYFSEGNHATIFGNRKKISRSNSSLKPATSEFMAMFKQGLAFNLPLFILGVIALLLYYLG